MSTASATHLRLFVVAVLLCAADLPRTAAQDDAEDVKRLLTDAAVADFTTTSDTRLPAVRKMFDLAVQTEIQNVGTYLALNDDQRKRLVLAGKGDFKNWLQRAEEVRLKYAGRPLSFEERRFADIEMSMVRLWPSNFSLDRDCLFQQTLNNIHGSDQIRGYADYRRAQRLKQLAHAWKQLASRRAGPLKLSEKSREALNEILIESAPPLPGDGTYQELIVLLQLEQLKDRVEAVLTDEEWQGFQAALKTAHGMERYLRHFELWPVPNQDDDR